ncbi:MULTISPECIES: TniB family NTP-binding protein [unclassified Cryobacterium]|nr:MULTISPECIES: TniB family NTP-binding protein [unclassified Cryobacterium]MDY7529216.1 TniB family NTP-binding protein [Cryobacterium sp. 10C2]MDY7558623.1 TniB family NTP-binding protein [Cryobacterium sp. 10C3]MEB0202569.1 TniB family NTP-binding protein [Cryobacterium sp. 5I3]MEB0289693.1 TniB family NTP-binding protein [Cryobacterium sp. 10C2]MEB0304515.1 TniB family NTP-binding protein [Cryobacterium sp. 10I1]
MKLLDASPTESVTDLPTLEARLRRISNRPRVLTAEEYLRLSGEEREVYDDARMLYLNRDLTVDTPAVKAALTDIRRLLLTNYGKPAGRHGLLLSGPSLVGKTHTAFAILHAAMNRYLADYPEPRAEGRIPLVYLEVPAVATAKSMMQQFCNFLGIPRGPRYTLEELTYMATQIMLRGKTALIVVDEVHNLSSTSKNTRDAIRALKGLSNVLPATFIYCGLNLEGNDLLTGDEGMQIAGRFTLRRMLPHSYGSSDARDNWTSTVEAFESGLGLIKSEGRCLEGEEEYLFSRTNGSIGSLGFLLRAAAIELLFADSIHEHGEERITRELLDSIPLDIAAERGAIA